MDIFFCSGYIAPEYYNYTEVTHQLSPLLDIYSLGIIIIEILTGRKGNIDADEVRTTRSSFKNKGCTLKLMHYLLIFFDVA